VIIAYLLYAAVKAVHEASHALAVRRFGGEVREMGVMLLLLLPLPYVDASAATGFRDKPARMLVGAAGIMAELALAAVATVVWLTVETGVTRDLAMGVMLIGSVSTLLFNGNPLLRFDGYHVLADLIEIPNLGSRSGSYYVYLAERHLLGRRDARSPVRAPGERVWFLGYGLASNAYRISVTLGIALLVAAQFQALGVLLALWVVAGQIVYPVVRALVTTARAPWLRARRARAVGTVGLLGALAVLAVAVLPVPLRSSAQGIVWIPDEAQLRASVDGFVTRVHVRPGEPVRAGQALLEIEEPLLEARAQALEWQVRELTARRDSELGEDAVEAALIAEELRRSRDELAQLHTEIEGLTLRGASGGTFVAADGRYLPGRHVSKGEVLGYVLAPGGSLTLRVAVDQATWELVGRRTESVRVMLVDRPYEAIEAQVLRVVPSAGSRLPSRALGRPGGGAIRVDARAAGAASPLEKVFVLDLEVAAPLEAQRLGLRGHVRFAHGSEPLAPRWYRAVRRLLLRRLAA
jgi:putative peptide zinc metalloprotease protein